MDMVFVVVINLATSDGYKPRIKVHWLLNRRLITGASRSSRKVKAAINQVTHNYKQNVIHSYMHTYTVSSLDSGQNCDREE